MLLPCYQQGCPHPVCISGKDASVCTWFANGPDVSFLPLPVADPDRPWGSKDCDSCTELGSPSVMVITYLWKK